MSNIQKWSDKAMFAADPIKVDEGPQVSLLSCNNDPLGTIAAAALMYEGKSVANLSQISDEQRRYYLEQVQRSVLEAPLEFVNLHFIISGVTRGFTHQMVRQRTATYTQESTRFAVKEVVPVGYPPSLIGTVPWKDWYEQCWRELYPESPVDGETGVSGVNKSRMQQVYDYATTSASKEQLWRREWDDAVGEIDSTYNALVSAGMPAEDARGLLPTNLLTRINYNTSLRGLKDHAGVRLCTQAQFEWRQVWAQMIKAIQEYGRTDAAQYVTTLTQDNITDPFYSDSIDGRTHYETGAYDVGDKQALSSQWQFDALADIFKPICYYKGKCQFMSDVDRHCSIRERVEANAEVARPSSEWHTTFDNTAGMLMVDGYGPIGGTGVARSKANDKPVWIGKIQSREYLLDPTSARISQ